MSCLLWVVSVEKSIPGMGPFDSLGRTFLFPRGKLIVQDEKSGLNIAAYPNRVRHIFPLPCVRFGASAGRVLEYSPSCPVLGSLMEVGSGQPSFKLLGCGALLPIVHLCTIPTPTLGTDNGGPICQVFSATPDVPGTEDLGRPDVHNQRGGQVRKSCCRPRSRMEPDTPGSFPCRRQLT